ncbi:MAG TPA: VWA domain-containing protein [Thermoanaerobaculia bacterium]|nr:VWA domain-containing protein [Thermoanaerobaculia bacterium]
MIRTAAAVFALVLLVPVTFAQDAPSIPWHTVPTVASAVARAQQKMLLVYFRDDCDTCNDDADALMRKLGTDEVLLRAFDAFLPLKITKGAVQHPIAEELSKREKVPLLAIYDASGVQLGVVDKLTTAQIGEDLLRFRSIRDLVAEAAALRLAGQEAAADFATGNALVSIARWPGAAVRFDKATEAYAKAGDKESEQLARVSAGYAWYGAGQKVRGRTIVGDILRQPISNAVAAEGHLAMGAIHVSQAQARQVDATPIAPTGRRGRNSTGSLPMQVLTSVGTAAPNRREMNLAVESYRKAYALAAPGTTTLEMARRALAQFDKRPLPPKEGVQAALRIVPPARRTLTGDADFLVETPGGVARVDFYLDEKKVASRNEAPFRASIDVGPTPRVRTLKARAFDSTGSAQGEAVLTINDRNDAFLVSIVSPAAATVEGETEVQLDVRVPPGRAVQKVDVSWNDVPVATLTAPPYRTNVQVHGREFGYLRAVGVLDDGTTSEATKIYNATGVSENVEVAAVTVIATVTDKAGKRMAGLTANDFAVEEEGRKVAASLRSSDDEPVTVGIAIDSSSSMQGKQIYVLRAASEFLGRIRDDDQSFIVAFDTMPRLVHPRSNNVESLRASVFDLAPVGGTSMFDGVTLALQQFQGIAGKKALIVFTDGREGVSSASAKECERLARTIGVPVYVVVPQGGERMNHALRTIAQATGGLMFHATPLEKLPAVFDQLAEDIRGQYVLSFERPTGVTPGSWRTIKVSVAKPGANVRTIQGYRAN